MDEKYIVASGSYVLTVGSGDPSPEGIRAGKWYPIRDFDGDDLESAESFCDKLNGVENTIISLLKDKDKSIHLQGNNVRLFWQNHMEDEFSYLLHDGVDRNWLDSGWHVITWKGSKVITLYFGSSLWDAIVAFKNSK